MYLKPKGAKGYPKLGVKYLNGRRVDAFQNDGNCCWTIFKKPGFRGEKTMVGVGFDGRPNLQPSSVNSIGC